MLSSIFTFSLLSITALASEQGKRQATDGAQYAAAASQIISQYIPETALPALQSAISSAAAAASVTGDAKSLLYDALLASSVPDWFASAAQPWSAQIMALESTLIALRPTAAGAVTTTDSAGNTVTTTGSTPGGTLAPVVIAITTTDSMGSTITTSGTGPT